MPSAYDTRAVWFVVRNHNGYRICASELETQFSSLQHDLISSASDLKRKIIEFEAKERENVEIEFERNLLLEKLKEREEKMRELQIVTARKFQVLLDKLKECEAKQRENSDKLSELEARDRELADELSCLEAIKREKCEPDAREREKRIKLMERISELERS
nr:hypothetical protein [Tanacetum cinerariifolium]